MRNLFSNKNSNVAIRKLANASFRNHRLRNATAILAIILTSFLFSAVLTIGMGTASTIYYSQTRLLGSQADVLIQGLTKEQIEQVKTNSMFKKVGCWISVEMMTNTNRINVEVAYADKEQQEIRFLTPDIGSAPEQGKEVLVSSNVLKDMGIKEEIGAIIPIEFSCGKEKHHFDMTVSGICESAKEETGYVIVSQIFLKDHSDVLDKLLERRNGIYSADVIMKDTNRLEERVSQFIRSIGGNSDDTTAENYVRVAPSPQLSNANDPMLLLAASVFSVLFIFSGYLLIYNIFDITVANEVKQYGLLRTIGTTMRQVKYLVNQQAIYLFFIGLPIGLVLGGFAGYYIMPSIIKILAIDYAGDEFAIGSLPYLSIIVGVTLLSGLTVFISTRKPVKKASRVSPIEAVRYVEPTKVNINRKKVRKGTVILRMAITNTQRSKKRERLIAVSLGLSMLMLNSIVIYVGSFDEELYIQQNMRSDFAVYNKDLGLVYKGFNGHESGLPKQVVNELEKLPGVYNEVEMYRNTYDDINIACDWGKMYSVDNSHKERRQLPESIDCGVYTDEKGNQYAALTPYNHLPLGNVFGVSENLIDKIDILDGEKDISVLKKKMREGNNIILMGCYNSRGEVKEGYFEGLNVGDKIQFYDEGVAVKSFTVIAKAAGTTGETTITGGGSNVLGNIGGPQIFMSVNNFKEIYDTPTLYSFLFDVDEENQKAVEDYLHNYVTVNEKILYTSNESLKAQIVGIKNILLLVGGLIGTIFALSGIINFANLIITNVISRRHEFAIMQSLGMTKQQLKRMLRVECLYYILYAAAVGIIITLILSLTLVKTLVEKGPLFSMMVFRMTMLPAMALIITFLILANVIPELTIRIFLKQSIVERLRSNE